MTIVDHTRTLRDSTVLSSIAGYLGTYSRLPGWAQPPRFCMETPPQPESSSAQEPAAAPTPEPARDPAPEPAPEPDQAPDPREPRNRDPAVKAWFAVGEPTMRAGKRVATVDIMSDIGAWGIGAKEFADSVKALGQVDVIDLRINSRGGSVFDALAMSTILAKHPARIEATVYGLAGSAATLPMVTADHVSMPAGSMIMIHDPAGVVAGGAKEMRQAAKLLDQIRSSVIDVYQAKTKLPADKIDQMMADETWMTAAQALEHGFADEVTKAVVVENKFDLSAFRHPPAGLVDASVASAKPNEAEAISLLCAEAGITSELPEILARGDSLDMVRAHVATLEARKAEVAEITSLYTRAGQVDMLAGVLQSGATLVEARSKLLDAMMSGQSPEIVNAGHGVVEPVQGAFSPSSADVKLVADAWAAYNTVRRGS